MVVLAVPNFCESNILEYMVSITMNWLLANVG